MEKLKNHRDIVPLLKQTLVVSGAALNILGHGCIHGYPAVLFSQLPRAAGNSSIEFQTSGNFVVTDDDTSWIASAVGFMGVFGILLSPLLMNRCGRQKAHFLSTIPAVVGWAIIYIAQNVPTLIIARCLQGIAIGIRSPLAAILVAEYTSPKYRGAFLGTFAVSLGLGILLTHFIGAFFTWRTTALVSSFSSVSAMVIIWFSPESPSWLAAKGRFEECSKSFRWLRGESSEQITELNLLIANQKIEKTERYDWNFKQFVLIFRKREFFKPAIIAISMFVIFEFGGAHIFPAYANKILAEVLNINNVHWQVTILDSLRMTSALAAIVLVKKFNRRTILFTSGLMTILSFISLSTYIYLRKHDVYSITLESFLPMTLMIIYTASFSLGLIPLTWVLCGEIFTLEYRSFGSSFSTFCLPPAFTLSIKTFPFLSNTLGIEGAYLVYAAILTVCLIIIYPILPETKGKTLQDIENHFKGGNSPSAVEIKNML